MLKSSIWKTLSSKKIYENPWISLRHDEFQTPNGKNGIYGVVSGKDFSLVIPKIGDDYFLLPKNVFEWGVARYLLSLFVNIADG